MLLRNQYSASIRVVSSGGLFSKRLEDAVLLLEMSVTGPSEFFGALVGSGKVEGRLVSVEKNGADLLPTGLAQLGKSEAAFSGIFTPTGPGAQELVVTWPGLATLKLSLTPEPGLASLAARGALDVVTPRYAWALDSVVVEGAATLESTEELPDTPVTPEPPVTPTAPPPPPASRRVRGIMLTDGMADRELAKARADEVAWLRTAYDTVLVLADLQAPGGPHGTSPKLRPYAGFARDKGRLTPLGLAGITFWKNAGFRVHVILRNAWACKHGLSAFTPSLQRPGVSEADLFTAAELEVDKAFVTDLLGQAGALVDGMMLVLEGSHEAAGGYSLELLKHIRDAGFQGMVVSNLVGDARRHQDALASAGALTASSINSPGEWEDSDQAIRNSDGMTSLTSANPDLIRRLTAAPGPRGFYLWAGELVGNPGGRADPLPSAFVTAAAPPGAGGGDPGSGPGPVNPGETPEQRCKRLYPGVGFGGGNGGGGQPPAPASHNTIWKPKSDSTGRLVLVCGHELPRVRHARILKNGAEVGRVTKMRSIGNGWRLNLDGDKAGAAYGTGLKVVITTDDGDVTLDVPNGGQRVEKRLPLPAHPPTGPVIPAPPPPEEVETLFVTTPTSLRLRDDFAAVVTKVDVLAAIHDPAVSPGALAATIVPASRSGNSWTIPSSIESYPRGNVPNTWRIRLAGGVPIPDGVTYHRSIMQSFVRVGDNPYGPGNRTYPPTIRT